MDATKLLGGLLQGSLGGSGGLGGLLGGGGSGSSGLGDLAGSLLGGSGGGMAGAGMGVLGGLIAGAISHFAGNAQDQDSSASVGAISAPPSAPGSTSTGKGPAPDHGLKTGSGKAAPPPPPSGKTATADMGGKGAPPTGKAAPSGTKVASSGGGMKGSGTAMTAKGGAPTQDEAVLLLKAMIASASADGVIDSQERKRIVGELERAGLNNEERAFLEREFQSPANFKEIAGDARSLGKTTETYAVSLLAVRVDTDAERTFLGNLAKAMSLDSNEQNAIHKQFGKPNL
ncbi:MAG: DUF533 domain-containing protein [Desulfovibrio sp.]|nr:MAG: DUF533 domain-containing protein [Desulfovibrio sp.]